MELEELVQCAEQAMTDAYAQAGVWAPLPATSATELPLLGAQTSMPTVPCVDLLPAAQAEEETLSVPPALAAYSAMWMPPGRHEVGGSFVPHISTSGCVFPN